MAVRDYTREIIDTVSQYKPMPRKPIDWSSISNSLNGMQTNFKTQALADALESGDQEAINKARAALDPTGFADLLEQQAQRAEDRAWEQEKLQKSFDLQKELSQMKYNQERNLAEFKAGLDNSGTTAMRNMQYLVSQGYTPQEAAALYYGGQNSTLDLGTLGKKGQEAYDKKIGEDLAQQAIADKQMRTLEPKVKNALVRAKDSLLDGEGLGQFGGWGWTTDKGGVNRANIKNAQAQINTTMRGLLKQMGVGSTELNSAAEAEAYRYMLSPDMPKGQQAQVISNFEKDYLSGNLARDLAETYAKPSLKQFNKNNNVQEGTIIEDANGNRLILRGGQWQQI